MLPEAIGSPGPSGLGAPSAGVGAIHASQDPIRFTLSMLGARGALVEDEGTRATALLPPELATELALPEECTLGLEGRDVVPCGLGSPLLERLVEQARAELAVAHARLEAEPPRAARARSLAEAFVVRNGVTSFVECLNGSAVYLLLVASWVAEADDRFEGLVAATLCAQSGDGPDPALEQALLVAAAGATSGLVRAESAGPDAPAASFEDRLPGILERLRSLVAERAAAWVEPIGTGVARRHAREHARIAEYFEAMVAELVSSKRKIDPQTMASRLGAVVADRDGKLLDLRERFALKVRLTPLVLGSFRVPCVTATVRVRRRQLERLVALRLPALARRLDHLACEGCSGFTERPAVCDRRLHVLCERCAPDARGRLACPACG
jgi:hypothetical protein